MKYLEVERVGRPETEGQRRRAACRGKEDRSPIRCVLPFWSLSLRPDLAISLSVCWVKFFFFRLGFFLSFNIYQCLAVRWFLILVYWFFFFFFFFFENLWVCYLCNLLGLPSVVFFFFLRIRGLAACSVTIFFFFFQILVQNFFQAFLFLFLFLFNLRVFLIFFKG